MAIICISIVDTSRPNPDYPGRFLHVGTYCFEIDYQASEDLDVLGNVLLPDAEHLYRPLLNRLLQLKEMPEALWGDGSAVEEPGTSNTSEPAQERFAGGETKA